MAAGALRYRVAFDKRASLSDGAGNVEGDWTEQFTDWSSITPLRGGAEVMAARLQSVQPVVIRVRNSSQTAAIAPGWRARDTESGFAYAVMTVSRVDGLRAYFDILCEGGKAA